jgi:O-antigen ligase
MLFLLLIIERRNKLILYSGLVVIAAGAFIAPVVYWDRISSIFRLSSYITEDYAIMSRVITMKVAVILGMKNPLFGVGLENFLYHAARYTSFGYVVHNSLLQVFSEMGFPGLLIIISIIIYNFRLISRLARDRTDKERARLGRFLLLQQMSVLFCSMTLPVAYDYVFWSALFMPSIAAYAYKARDKAASRV